MFTESTAISRSSRILHVPSIEAPMFAPRRVNGGWVSIERKYLENARSAARPLVHWYVSDGASRPSAHWSVSGSDALGKAAHRRVG
jgi:hypothetical protein